MRRWVVVLVVLVIMSAACTGGTEVAPSTESSPRSSGPTVSTPDSFEPSATVPADTSTTETDSLWPAVDVLVTNDDGVFLIDSEGEVTQLVRGRVAYAVDDTRGGLLFQVERGRSTGWWGDGSPIKDTRVWWVPQGSGEALELLVPSPRRPLDLSLVDAVIVDDEVLVLYVRHDSMMDFEFGPHGWHDSVRMFELDGRTVSQLLAVGAWERSYEFSSGGGLLLVGGETIAGVWCSISPVTVLPGLLVEDVMPMAEWDSWGSHWALPGIGVCPASRGGSGDEPDCPSRCVLSSDASKVGFVESEWTGGGEADHRVGVIDTQTGRLVTEFDVESALDLDVDSGFIAVNHEDDHALLVELSGTSPRYPAPVPGLARFVSSRVDIEGPVSAPAPVSREHEFEWELRPQEGIPWEMVDDRWFLVMADVEDRPVLALIGPDGTSYELMRWSSRAFVLDRTIVDWSPDKRSVLLQLPRNEPTVGTELWLVDLPSGERRMVESVGRTFWRSLQWAGFTRSAGDELVVKVVDSSSSQLERRSFDGDVLAILNRGDLDATWLYARDGSFVVVTDSSGMKTVDEHGNLIRLLKSHPTDVPDEQWRISRWEPLGWWTDTTLMANLCGRSGTPGDRTVCELWQIPVDGTDQIKLRTWPSAECVDSWPQGVHESVWHTELGMLIQVQCPDGGPRRLGVYNPAINRADLIEISGSGGDDRVAGVIDGRLLVVSVSSGVVQRALLWAVPDVQMEGFTVDEVIIATYMGTPLIRQVAGTDSVVTVTIHAP